MRFKFIAFIASIYLISCQNKNEEYQNVDLSTFIITNASLKKELTDFIKRRGDLQKNESTFSGHNEEFYLIDFGTYIIEDKPNDTLVKIYNAKPYNCSDCKGILYYMDKKVFFSSPFKNLDGIIEVKKPFEECEKYNGGEFDLPPQMQWKFSNGKLLRLDK